MTRVRRGALGLVAEHGDQQWILPDKPSRAAVAELRRLRAIRVATNGLPGSTPVRADLRAIAGRDTGMAWEKLPVGDLVRLLDDLMRAWRKHLT